MSFWKSLGDIKLKSLLPVILAFLGGWSLNLLVQINVTIEQLQLLLDAALKMLN